MNAITLTRQELYNLVWSEPLLTLSKRYQISDVGLRKICIRMAIPLPSVGHWNKVKAGKKVIIKPFTIQKDVEQQVNLALKSNYQNAGKNEPSALSVLQQIIVDDPLVDLAVKDTLTAPDPLVVSAQKALSKKSKYHRDGDMLFAGSSELSISVSEVLLNRALCIMDTFIKAMRQRGHNFRITDTECYVVLGKEEMTMNLCELRNRIIIEQPYEHTDFRPNGLLSFRFKRFGTTTEIKDGKYIIEQQLSKLIARLELLGGKFRLEEIEWERRRAIAREETRKKEEFEKRKKLELISFKQVLKDSKRWKETMQLRAYIDHVEQRATAEGNLNEEFQVWLTWIKEKADWFDPLMETHDEWLSDIDQNSLLADQVNTSPNSYLNYHQNIHIDHAKERKRWPLSPWYSKKRD